VDHYKPLIETAGFAVDVAGVVTIVIGLLIATARYLFTHAGLGTTEEVISPYRQYRQDLGRAILLGLEMLVAADIVRTVAISPTLESVVILGGIVLIRTFLSLSLEAELGGRFPWQPPRTNLEARDGSQQG
jgi:uncharacterized membrane protein